nr:myosin-7B-like [Aegilops tauschii subsp. strangulata]
MSANFQKLQALHRAHLDKATSRMAAVDKAEADLAGRVAETHAWFRQAHEELKVAQDLLAKRKLELVMKQADIKKAQELAKEQAAKDEAARHQHQQTEELEQRHEEALDAQAQVQADKVKELEVERDGLKEQALKLAKEKDTLNGALVEAQGVVLGKANDSSKDLKLKLEGLEAKLSEVLTKVVHWNPSLDFDAALESLPEDADLTTLEEYGAARLVVFFLGVTTTMKPLLQSN